MINGRQPEIARVRENETTDLVFMIFTSVTLPRCEKIDFNLFSSTCNGRFFTHNLVVAPFDAVAAEAAGPLDLCVYCRNKRTYQHTPKQKHQRFA